MSALTIIKNQSPVLAGATPEFVGQQYVDLTERKVYTAIGTAGAEDFVISQGGGGGGFGLLTFGSGAYDKGVITIDAASPNLRHSVHEVAHVGPGFAGGDVTGYYFPENAWQTNTGTVLLFGSGSLSRTSFNDIDNRTQTALVLDNLNIYAVRQDPSDNTLYALSQGFEMYTSTDDGVTWQPFDWIGTAGLDPSTFAPSSPLLNDIAFGGTGSWLVVADGGEAVYYDGAATYTHVTTQSSASNVDAVVFLAQPDVFVAADYDTGEVFAYDPATSGANFSLALANVSEGVKLISSPDGSAALLFGGSFGNPGQMIRVTDAATATIEALPTRGGPFVAAAKIFLVPSDAPGQAYYSEDNGASWTPWVDTSTPFTTTAEIEFPVESFGKINAVLYDLSAGRAYFFFDSPFSDVPIPVMASYNLLPVSGLPIYEVLYSKKLRIAISNLPALGPDEVFIARLRFTTDLSETSIADALFDGSINGAIVALDINGNAGDLVVGSGNEVWVSVVVSAGGVIAVTDGKPIYGPQGGGIQLPV